MKRYRGGSSNPDHEALERLQRAELGLEEALQLHSTLEAEEQAEQSGRAGRTSTAPVCSERLRAALHQPGVGGNRPLSYFEELCLREMDGELSPEEQAELERLCGEYAIYARRRAVLEWIVFRPDTTIVYRQKASLKRGVFTWHTGSGGGSHCDWGSHPGSYQPLEYRHSASSPFFRSFKTREYPAGRGSISHACSWREGGRGNGNGWRNG